jgi:hypothetical protein
MRDGDRHHSRWTEPWAYINRDYIFHASRQNFNPEPGFLDAWNQNM